MDAGHILVAVLTSAAIALLVWAEVHSRRNAAMQSAQESQDAPESKTKEDRPIIAATRASQKNRSRARVS
jgi:hypothetical protein